MRFKCIVGIPTLSAWVFAFHAMGLGFRKIDFEIFENTLYTCYFKHLSTKWSLRSG